MISVIRNYSSSDFNRVADFYGRTAEHASLLENGYPKFLIQKFKRPGYDPSKNFFIVERKKKLIGCADLVYEAQIKRAILDILVSPSCRREGLGSDLLGCLLKRCRDLRAVSLQVNVPEINRGAPQFLFNQGFSFVRYFFTFQLEISKTLFMDWDFKDIVLSNFKTGEEEELAALQNKIFFGSWGFCPNTAEEIIYYLQLTGIRIEEVMCIEAKGRKSGYVWPYKPPGDNGRIFMRIHMFGMDPDFRGKGLGKKLLQKAICQMGEQGANTVGLTVDSKNTPAVSLYDSLGFKLKSRSLWYEKVIS